LSDKLQTADHAAHLMVQETARSGVNADFVSVSLNIQAIE
jgi:hypothetical protein